MKCCISIRTIIPSHYIVKWLQMTERFCPQSTYSAVRSRCRGGVWRYLMRSQWWGRMRSATCYRRHVVGRSTRYLPTRTSGALMLDSGAWDASILWFQRITNSAFGKSAEEPDPKRLHRKIAETRAVPWYIERDWPRRGSMHFPGRGVRFSWEGEY